MPAKKTPKNDAAAAKAEDEAEFSYTEGLAQLSHILGKLQDEQTSLEESFTLFQQGNTLLQRCRKYLDETEMSVKQVIAQSDGSLHEQDFE